MISPSKGLMGLKGDKISIGAARQAEKERSRASQLLAVTPERLSLFRRRQHAAMSNMPPRERKQQHADERGGARPEHDLARRPPRYDACAAAMAMLALY